MTDDNGTVVWSANYTPFGKAEIGVNTMTNNFRFPGQYYDEETGLHYNYFRYYDSGTGRYITPDPIGLTGGINLYAYVGNNPVNWIDPLGLRRGRRLQDRRNPFHLPWDRRPRTGAPDRARHNCETVLEEYCDDEDICCDWDECAQTCRAKCPIYKSPSSNPKMKCMNPKYRLVTFCPGREPITYGGGPD